MKKKYHIPKLEVLIVEFECSISAASVSPSGGNGGFPSINDEVVQEAENDWTFYTEQ